MPGSEARSNEKQRHEYGHERERVEPESQADAEAESRARDSTSPEVVAGEELDAEQLQALEQWLRRIPDDPGGLLRRKFDYQYRQRQLDNQFQPPKQGKPVW